MAPAATGLSMDMDRRDGQVGEPGFASAPKRWENPALRCGETKPASAGLDPDRPVGERRVASLLRGYRVQE